MRYYTVLLKGEERVAASRDGKELFILEGFADMNELMTTGGIGDFPEGAQKISVTDVKLLSPIPRPQQDVLCLGINYTAHAEEAERFSKESFGGERPYPIFFSKRVCYSQGTDALIPAYTGLVDSLDYECELGVVIGKDAKNVKREFGKSLDGFTPMGPCIVSADEFAFPPKQRIACRVNGDVRQNSSTANLITGITDIIVMLSEGMTLKAGTVIATGTPAGVGMGMKPPTFLKPGDVVECEIEGIGVLRNYIEG